ncbi:MAG: hypothetical protein V1676_02065 [Candidatus Diapherotrites archaeon]
MGMDAEVYEKRHPLGMGAGDFMFTSITLSGGKKRVAAFTVMQVCETGSGVHKIIMFDTAHGYCHVHRFYRGLGQKHERCLDGEISMRAFRECRADIKNNWERYKEAYFMNRLSK